MTNTVKFFPIPHWNPDTGSQNIQLVCQSYDFKSISAFQNNDWASGSNDLVSQNNENLPVLTLYLKIKKIVSDWWWWSILFLIILSHYILRNFLKLRYVSHYFEKDNNWLHTFISMLRYYYWLRDQSRTFNWRKAQQRTSWHRVFSPLALLLSFEA